MTHSKPKIVWANKQSRRKKGDRSQAPLATHDEGGKYRRNEEIPFGVAIEKLEPNTDQVSKAEKKGLADVQNHQGKKNTNDVAVRCRN